MNQEAENLTIEQLNDYLSNCTGSDDYYKNYTGLLYTQGIAEMAEVAQAHWLIDLAGSYQHGWVKKIPFQVWTLTVRPDYHAVVEMREDTGQPAKIRQKIEFTDFPAGVFEFYVIDGVMLLKSEY